MCKFRPRRSFLILAKFPPAGIGRFSQSGRRLVPGIEACSENAMKSSKFGPEFRLSVNVVGRRRGVSEEIVASVRCENLELMIAFFSRTIVCSSTLVHLLNVRIVNR